MTWSNASRAWRFVHDPAVARVLSSAAANDLKGANMRGGRIKRGIGLAKSSWSVIRSHPALIWFPVIGGLVGGIAAVILFVPGVAIVIADNKAQWALIPFGLIAAYALTFSAIFFSVGLAACVSDALDGKEVTFGGGIAVARSRMRVIAAWSLVQLTVGVVLNLIQGFLRDQGGVGQIVGAAINALGSFAWAVASFFVIPIIALEGLGPKDALKESVAQLKQKWGEGAVGSAAIGIVLLPFFLIAFFLMFGGASVAKNSPPAGHSMLALGVILIGFSMLMSASISAVFRVALFRFAKDGTVAEGFAQEQLDGAFIPKGKGLR